MSAARAAAATLALAAFARCALADTQLAACASITDDLARLACYDSIARGPPPETVPAAIAPGVPAAPVAPVVPVVPVPPSSASTPVTSSIGIDVEPTVLERRWELRPELKRGIFAPQPYRPLYGLVHGTTNINQDPSSPTRAAAPDDIRLQRAEAKLQLSFKVKLWEDMLRSPADLWFGYTQVSYWQAANGRFSSPFRETNYQPEGIVVYPLSTALGDVRLRYASAAFVHESNGRASVLSRSWNRVIGDVALEYGPWSLDVRPWLRVDTSTGPDDDNPDILDYVGRGELIATYRSGRHVVTLAGRHSLRGGDRSRGSLRLDWAFPLTGGLDGHVQMFTGYGESLIDYNHRQTTLGLGLSFFD